MAKICKTCKYGIFETEYYTDSDGIALVKKVALRGSCHRYPPSFKGFPSINDGYKSWCGEHKKRK